MITFSKLGRPGRGRLGNHLFQIASTIGISCQEGHEYTFPAWDYSKYFARPWKTGGQFEAWELPEQSFTFYRESEMLGRRGEHFDLDGWRQSERYWELCPDEIRRVFEFEPVFFQGVADKWAEALSRPCIAISVRRGDFVGNPNYAQIPARYYVLGLFDGIPDWKSHNVIMFSDDMDYCRAHFSGLPGVYFADGTDIEQLALMTMCRHFIISNSTFSWWGAWLGEKRGSIVIRPPKNFAGPLAAANSEADYWPERWQVLDYTRRKIPLQDVTFTVPVFIDHPHRTQNLELSTRQILENFDTTVIVMEQGGRKASSIQRFGAIYHEVKSEYFHRTKMLNDMAKMATTTMVVNWDCDVFVPMVQIMLAADAIRNGADMVYPYDGRFARVPRDWYQKLAASNDIGIFGDTPFTGKYGKPVPTTSVGGAIMFHREAFLNGGGENEYMISFGPEDWERFHRFQVLGYEIKRIPGVLYHLDHWCGPNSSSRNPHFKHNHKELDDMRAMTEDQLVAYVMTWPWRS